MSDPLIFLCKTGSITQPSKVALRKAGVIVVEVAHPADCSLMRSQSKMSGDQITAASLKALCSQSIGTVNVNGTAQVNSIGKAQEIFVRAMSDILNPPVKP